MLFTVIDRIMDRIAAAKNPIRPLVEYRDREAQKTYVTHNVTRNYQGTLSQDYGNRNQLNLEITGYEDTVESETHHTPGFWLATIMLALLVIIPILLIDLFDRSAFAALYMGKGAFLIPLVCVVLFYAVRNIVLAKRKNVGGYVLSFLAIAALLFFALWIIANIYGDYSRNHIIWENYERVILIKIALRTFTVFIMLVFTRLPQIRRLGFFH